MGGVSYAYDGNANLTGDGTWTYVYDTENHLLTANKTGVSASYVYAPSHRRIQKTVGTIKTRYVYAVWQRIADYDGVAGTLQNRYVYGVSLDEPLIQVSSSGALTYLHADRLGSIIATSDSTGAVTNKSKFSPWGENAPVGTTFGFTGQRYDAETGLYYYKNRHYSPALGRFLQPDPSGYSIKLDDCGCGCGCGSDNSDLPTAANTGLYTYTTNDGLNLVDMDGRGPSAPPATAPPSVQAPVSPMPNGFPSGNLIGTLALIDILLIIRWFNRVRLRQIIEQCYQNAETKWTNCLLEALKECDPKLRQDKIDQCDDEYLNTDRPYCKSLLDLLFLDVTYSDVVY